MERNTNLSDRAGLGLVFYHFTLNIEAGTRSASDDKMNHGSNIEIETRIFIRHKIKRDSHTAHRDIEEYCFNDVSFAPIRMINIWP